jgi:hypothetical protein
MESMNAGKVFAHAYLLDVEISIKALQYFAGWADKIHGQTIPSGKSIWDSNGMMVQGKATVEELSTFKFSLIEVSINETNNYFFLLHFVPIQFMLMAVLLEVNMCIV